MDGRAIALEFADGFADAGTGVGERGYDIL